MASYMIAQLDEIEMGRPRVLMIGSGRLTEATL